MSRVIAHLLLVLCLVLNGIGSAIAAAAMPSTMGAMSAPMDAQLDTSEAGPPSEGGCDHGDMSRSRPAEAVPAAPAAPHPADCGDDCCLHVPCDCPCMQGAYAALPDVAVVPAFQGRAAIAPVFPRGHAAPFLHGAIRPPIG